MNAQRLVALGLVAIQAAAIEHMLFLLEWYPAAVLALAVVATPGWIALPLGRMGRVVGAIGLGLFVYAGMYTNLLTFLVTHRLPVESVLGGYSHAVAWYLLTVQAAILFLRSEEDRLPAYFPALGAMVLACAGASGRHGSLDPAYHAGALAFVVLVALYGAFEPQRQRRGERVPAYGRGLVIQGAVIAVALAGSFVLSTLVGSYRNAIDGAVFSLVPGLLPPANIGFSTHARLDSVARLHGQQGEIIALRVFADSKPGYLRGRAYDRYNRGVWDVTGPEHPLEPARERPAGIYAEDTDTFFRLRTDGEPLTGLSVAPAMSLEGYLFVPLETVFVALANSPPVEDENWNVRAQGLVGAARYGVCTSPGPVSGSLTEDLRQRLLALPDDLDPRVRDLAARLFAGQVTAGQKIAAVRAYFNANYTYQFGIQVPRDRDPLTYFLLDRPPAHCEYFATGAAILLRLGGVPCRYVMGFVVAEHNGVGGYWMARNRDAHAWVEAYDAERSAWVTVEATVADGVPGADPQKWTSLFAHVMDSILYLYQRLAVAIVTGHWLNLLGEAVAKAPGWIVSPVGGIILVLAAGYVIVMRRRRISESAPRPPTSPNAAALTRLRRYVDRQVRRLGFARRPEETIHAFTDRIASALAEPSSISSSSTRKRSPARTQRLGKAVEWYRIYCEVRFRRPVTPEELDRLRSCLPD